MSRRRVNRPYPPEGGRAAPPIRSVLFDFGDTLFNHAPERHVIRSAALQLGAELTSEQADDIWAEIDRAAQDPEEVALGRDLDAAVWTTRWRVLYGLADRVVEGLGAAIDADMHDPRAWVPYADTQPTLRALADAAVPVGVLSNTGWDIRSPFTVRGLDRYVASFTLSCEAKLAKPDPAVFLAACTSLGADPATTLMVGDNPRADGGATSAGLQALILPPAARGTLHGLASVLALTTQR